MDSRRQEPAAGSVDGRARFLKGIAEISRAVMERYYLDDLLTLIVSVTAEVTGATVCSILLVDKKKSELVLRASRSGSGLYCLRTNTPLGRGIAGCVARDNKPIAVKDVRRDPRFLNRKMAVESGLISLLAVPISIGGEVIGVLNCYTSQEYKFTPQDVQMLTTVAGQAAVVLRNTELRIMKEVLERESRDREMVERAKSILAKKRGISSIQAFQLLRNHSMNTRTSMARIAESIVVSAGID